MSLLSNNRYIIARKVSLFYTNLILVCYHHFYILSQTKADKTAVNIITMTQQTVFKQYSLTSPFWTSMLDGSRSSTFDSTICKMIASIRKRIKYRKLDTKHIATLVRIPLKQNSLLNIKQMNIIAITTINTSFKIRQYWIVIEAIFSDIFFRSWRALS